MYSKINTKDSLWLLVNGNAPFMAKAAQAGVKPKAVFGSINVTDGLTVDMRIRLGSPDEATQLVNMAKGQTIEPAGQADVRQARRHRRTARTRRSRSRCRRQKLKQLVAMVGGMMGGMMGAGGGGMGGTP